DGPGWVTPPGPLRFERRARTMLLDHIDRRTDAHPIVEMDHVGVQHANAARRDRAADRAGIVGAVDAEERAADVKRAGAERVAWAAFHIGRNGYAFGGFAGDHLGRRAPARPFLLGDDVRGAGPLEALATDADLVANRL